MTIREITNILESIAPLSFQEKYDNSGLLIGDPNAEVISILCTVDVTLEVINEAVSLGANLIICHHPPLFEPVRKITGSTVTEQIITQSIRNNLSIYAAHTSLDNSPDGVNKLIANKLGLKNCQILHPVSDFLFKLVTFVPVSHGSIVREAIFNAGAGHIGNYDSCSFNIPGHGTFKAGLNTNPFVGEKGVLHTEDELRIETVVPRHKINVVISAMLKAHPYEEVAYDIYSLSQEYKGMGSGLAGEMEKSLSVLEFLESVKNIFNIPVIRYSGNIEKNIKKIAICGGSGAFLIKDALNAGVDAFLTGDIKYHQFFEVENKILLCDIGHYESEQFTKDLFYLLLNKKNSKFAVHLSKVITNPINYYL